METGQEKQEPKQYRVGDRIDNYVVVDWEKNGEERPDSYVYHIANPLRPGAQHYLKVSKNLIDDEPQSVRDFVHRFPDSHQCPHIESYDVAESADGRYLHKLAWFADNSYLSETISSEEIPRWGRLLKAIADYAEALRVLHGDAGIGPDVQEAETPLYHGNVCPAYFFVRNDIPGQIGVLAGFGPAVRPSKIDELRELGIGAGTVGYQAPERLLGADPSAASDIWGLGASMYELITGHRVFGTVADVHHEEQEYAEYKDLCENHRAGTCSMQLDALDGQVTPSVRRIVEKCLRWEPSERFGSASELKDALLDALVHAESTRFVHQRIVQQRTKSWFDNDRGDSSVVQHSWDVNLENNKALIHRYLEAAFGYPPPKQWFQNDSYKVLHENVKWLTGSYSALGTSNPRKYRPSIASIAIMFGAADIRHREHVNSFRWTRGFLGSVPFLPKDVESAELAVSLLVGKLFHALAYHDQDRSRSAVESFEVQDGLAKWTLCFNGEMLISRLENSDDDGGSLSGPIKLLNHTAARHSSFSVTLHATDSDKCILCLSPANHP